MVWAMSRRCRARKLLSDRQRALIKFFCFAVVTLGVVDEGKVVERVGQVDMTRANTASLIASARL